MEGTETGEPATEVFERVLDELHAVAAAVFHGERTGHTLQPTAVVNELWLKLADRPDLRFESEAAFMSYASKVFRHVLVDYARWRGALKRGGGLRCSLDVRDTHACRCSPVIAIAAADALRQLEIEDGRAARVFEMRFFGGMTASQIAGILDVSTRTVRSDWAYARAWMAVELGEDEPLQGARTDQTRLSSSSGTA